jgi:acyl transferase domain-containing protein
MTNDASDRSFLMFDDQLMFMSHELMIHYCSFSMILPSIDLLHGSNQMMQPSSELDDQQSGAVKKFDAEYWWTNVRQPVNFLSAITSAHEKVKPEIMIEISPHIALRSPVRDYYNNVGEPMPNYIYTLVRKSNTADMFARAVGSCFKARLPLSFRKLYPRPRPMTNLLSPYH